MLTRLLHAAALSAALLVAMPVSAGPVSAPTKPDGRALILIPLTLTKVQDLSFGTIIAHPTTSVTVVIHPRTGARTTSHAANMFPGDVGQRGLFAGAGTPGQQVEMVLTAPAFLTDPGGNQVSVVDLYMDTFDPITIPSSHYFFVGVGGIISVPANAPDGLYTSQFDITADYQ